MGMLWYGIGEAPNPTSLSHHDVHNVVLTDSQGILHRSNTIISILAVMVFFGYLSVTIQLLSFSGTLVSGTRVSVSLGCSEITPRLQTCLENA